MKEKTILIVDDTPENIRLLFETLKGEYKIIAANNGLKALQLSSSPNPPDIILLDIMMPEMDGYEVCARLKAEEATKEIPIIFISAKSDVEDETKGLALGAVDFISKPFSPPVVKARVSTHLLLKTAREEAEAARENAEAANRAKSEFLASMSHEIRTPLNAILGMADLLWESELTGDQKKYIDILRNAGDNLLNLINDILDLSKVEAGQMKMEAIAFDLVELIEKVCEVLALKMDLQAKPLLCDIDVAVAHFFIGDPNRLRQVLINLVGNALKFTEKGEVLVTAAPYLPNTQNRNDTDSPNGRPPDRKHKILFSVKDSGIGIPDASQKGIFQKFKQVDASTTRKYGGTGLGLAICKQLVEMMGGEIWFESVEAKGTTFFFTAQFEMEKNKTPLALSLMHPFPGLPVLVIDHHRQSVHILKKMLEAYQADATTARDGNQLVEALRKADATQTPYKLILINPLTIGIDKTVLNTLAASPGRIVMLLNPQPILEVPAPYDTLNVTEKLIKPIRYNELGHLLAIASGIKRVIEDHPIHIGVEPPAEKRSLKILLVEDNKDNQSLFCFNLKKTPHQIDIAENGAIAYQKFIAQKYDIVFMDKEMPVMDGYEATQKIRRWESEQNQHPTPIVALTAHAIKGAEQKSFDVGSTAYITKPFKKVTLLQTLEKLCY